MENMFIPTSHDFQLLFTQRNDNPRWSYRLIEVIMYHQAAQISWSCLYYGDALLLVWKTENMSKTTGLFETQRLLLSKTLPFTLSGHVALSGWTSVCAPKKQGRVGWHSVSGKLFSASFFLFFFLVFFCPVLSFTPTPGFTLLFPSYTTLLSPCNFLLLCFQSFRIIYYCKEVKTIESLTVWKLY